MLLALFILKYEPYGKLLHYIKKLAIILTRFVQIKVYNMINDNFCINSNKAILSRYNKNQFYFMPHPMLRRYISHYTITYPITSKKNVGNFLSDDLVIIPDGSGCMIYGFNNKGTYEIFWGPTSKPVKVKRDNPADNERMFFVEFLPGGIYALTGIPQKEIRDLQCSIYDIDTNLSMALGNAIKSSKRMDELIFKVDSVLIQAIANSKRTETSITPVIDQIMDSGGTASIKSLSESIYISERHLNRLFEKNIGLNVKLFERLTRINKAVKAYKNSAKQNSTDIAYQLGFFDQSHLIRDFNDFCSTTPNNFIKNMSDFYNEPFKY